MILINSISTTKFTYNGVEYYKNFMPIVRGGTIAVINAYDSKVDLSGATPFADFVVDGVSYGTIELTQTALLPVLFNRSSSGSGIQTIVAGDNITVDATDPVNPIVSSIISDILVTDTNVTGTFDIDYINDTWDLILTGNTTFTESNLPIAGITKVLSLYVTGDFALTYPSNWTNSILGTYDGTVLNQIIVEYRSTGNYFVTINQPS
jgi:hypothetical protein